MGTTVKYKGNTIATLSNETKTLTTAGTWVEGDISITDVFDESDIIYTATITGSTNNGRIFYNGTNYCAGDTFTFSGGDSCTVYVLGKTTCELYIDGEKVKTGLTPLSYNYTLPNYDILVTFENNGKGYITFNTIQITSNGKYDVEDYIRAEVNIAASLLQSKSATPTESQQTVTPDSGYDGLSSVTVGAISSTYVGSGITTRSSTDLTTSGATVTVPAGYYSSNASKSVTTMTLPTSASSSSSGTSKATIGRSTSAQYINIPTGYNATASYYTISATPNGTVTAPSSISGTSATVSTGTNTLTLTKTVSVTPNVTTAGYISTGTAGNSSVSLTASVTTKGAATITPTTSNQTIASGTYLTGTQTISGDANLVAGNIKSGVSIFGVSGSLAFSTIRTGTSTPASSLGVNGDVYIKTS